MWRGRIKGLIGAALFALAAGAAPAAADPFAYKLEVTPEEGPLVPAVEARYTPAYRQCGKGSVTTRDAADCLEAEFARQDKALGAAWKAAFARTKGPAHAALLNAQRQWIANRDPFCRKLSDEYSGGTIAPVIWSSCRVETTIRRTMWLEKLK